MSKTLKIYLFSFAVLIVLMVAIDQSRTQPLDWNPSYQLDDKIPLGLYLLDNEIDGLVGDSVKRYKQTFYEYYRESDSLHFTPETYLFINNYIPLDETSVEKLLENVKRGSSAFIGAEDFSPYLKDTLHARTRYQSYYENIIYHNYSELNSGFDRDTLGLSLANPKWGERIYKLSPIFGNFVFGKVDAATTTALGYMIYPDSTKYLSFIKIKFGQGYFFLHTQPSTFCNYSLMDKDLQEYAENTLSYLPNGQPVVWFVRNQYKEEPDKSTTPLSVIFKYPALRMVWLIFVYGLLLFIIFTAKRRQRVVPIIKPLRNTTVEFAQTIGNLYFQEGDSSNIARKKIIYFLDRIRQTYYIDTHSLDDAFVQRLHLKSGKELSTIRNAVNFIRRINERGSCDEIGLTLLNEYTEKFWDNPQNANK
ncbi:MAG: hypothetical protein LBS52_07015 [Dysgonamonadaceae bacterium]|jgi:hypothetical protein|nr:hypothetical protein [Dysgonamonadaceae bacterium]